MTITEFLTARYDEDEAAARAASPGPWEWLPESEAQWDSDGGPTLIRTERKDDEYQSYQHVAAGYGYDAWGMTIEQPDMDHIARYAPDRVLADIAAKREILVWCCERVQIHIGPKDFTTDYLTTTTGAVVLRILALPHADHPDYREEWKP